MAPIRERGQRLAGAAGLSSEGERLAPDAVALAHELVEALTATGNYLSAATRILKVEPPSGEMLAEVLEKSLTQFARAVEAVERLRGVICPESPGEDNNS